MTKNSRKKLSALNGLSLALSSVAPETDLAAYEHHTKQYFEDCQPAFNVSATTDSWPTAIAKPNWISAANC